MKIIYLEWADAHTNAGWLSKEDAKLWAERDEWIIQEVGWLVEETDKYICFATAKKPENEYDQMMLLNVHKIPKTWIKNRKTLKI